MAFAKQLDKRSKRILPGTIVGENKQNPRRILQWSIAQQVNIKTWLALTIGIGAQARRWFAAHISEAFAYHPFF